MLKELASDSQMYCLSSLCLVVTTTLSATATKIKPVIKKIATMTPRTERTQESRVESYTKLADEIACILAGGFRVLHFAQEISCPGFSDCAKISD